MVNNTRIVKEQKHTKRKKKTIIIFGAIGGVLIILLSAYAIFLSKHHAWSQFGQPFWFKEDQLYFGERKCCDGERLNCSPFGYYSMCRCRSDKFPPSVDKPIVYLYPETKTDIDIKFGKPEKLTTTYPEYKDRWSVTAMPNGDLIDRQTGNKLYALYWEGIDSYNDIDLSEGFIVDKDNIVDFLEEKLEILGLNYKEKEEFIIYWLPKMEINDYNYVHFLTTEEVEKRMPIEMSVKPDTVIRILMLFGKTDKTQEIKEQKLEETPIRKGFTMVEWGGSEISDV